MRKKYYVEYYKRFANTYNLYYAETSEQVKVAEKAGLERITRKEAEKLCVDENYRRKNDHDFSGYADNVIYPIDYNGDWINDKRVYKDGYMILYRGR